MTPLERIDFAQMHVRSCDKTILYCYNSYLWLYEYNRTAEVRGSIPLSSTSPTHGHSEACRTPGFRRNELPSSAIRHDRNMVAIEHPANVAGPPRQHLIDLLEHFLIVAANADRNI